MTLRAIEAILPPDNLHFVGDGFRVYGILGRREPLTMKRMSPFLLMDYAPVHYFPPNDGSPRGVGSHPHRGIETVTIAYKGKVEHNDSTGAGGIIEEGGVLIYETFSKGNEIYGRPKNPNYLLQPEELIDIVRPSMRIISFKEGYSDEGRKSITQKIVAIKRAAKTG